MQQIDHLFNKLCSFKYLFKAYKKACKGKSSQLVVRRFNYHLEKNLLMIVDQLKNFEYQFGPYNRFIIESPKRRVIESATFRDKIVHYCIYDLLNEFFEKKFITTTYACIKGRGHHKAMLKLHTLVNNANDRYYFQGDIKKYFASIDRKVLSQLLHKAIADQSFMKIIDSLNNDAPMQIGLPIGNLTSQLFANVYLNELDQYIKRTLSVKNYIRYMDDFVIIVDSKQEALVIKEKVRIFLIKNLKLELAPHKIHLGPLKKGLSFVGYKLQPGNIRLRGQSLRRFRKKNNKMMKKDSTKAEKSLISFLGHASYCSDFISLAWLLRQDIKLSKV